ncbi:hypothetical protein F5Y18DRAFT_428924 [Xylariaceae sp. FL1019]|nr:hypothetical protein F5Y18DRAFT_428924 [Xylariaceae sp. FL1019]
MSDRQGHNVIPSSEDTKPSQSHRRISSKSLRLLLNILLLPIIPIAVIVLYLCKRCIQGWMVPRLESGINDTKSIIKKLEELQAEAQNTTRNEDEELDYLKSEARQTIETL